MTTNMTPNEKCIILAKMANSIVADGEAYLVAVARQLPDGGVAIGVTHNLATDEGRRRMLVAIADTTETGDQNRITPVDMELPKA